ncbi:MAG: hypothetical protein Ta2F_18400 [Termitinemataceae bacterium]|nr:MAG: hypothetical protein Ta2F_18400 [Termitinemataceae bacterium]
MTSELISVLKQVISSPEVIGIAIVIILFWNIVLNAANPKPKKIAPNPKEKKLKRPKAEKTSNIPKNIETDGLELE